MTDQKTGAAAMQEVPPEGQIMQLAMGAFAAQALYVAAKLSIADVLADGPKTTAELATVTETDAPSLYRLLRMLAGFGVFAETSDGTFVNTPISDTIRADAPRSMRAMMLFMADEAHWRAYSGLMYSVKTGKTAWEHIYGMPFFEYAFEQNKELGDIFNQAMTSNSHPQIGAVLAAYDFSGIGTIADIAGGHGHMLGAILQKYPSTKGVLFDLGSVLEGAPQMLASYGVADRVQLVEGDFFGEIPVVADAYIMKHIIHDWYDDKAGQILGCIRRSMPDDARVLIVDCVIPPGNDPHPGKVLDIEMLLLPGGKERTAAEFEALLADSGLRMTRIVPTQAPVSIVEAVKA